jgi:hypothetical protein
VVVENTCTIRIVRPNQFADRIRSYRILVNGKDAGKIAADSTLDIAAPAGDVTIQARIDWGRSRPLTINAPAGRTIEIEVSNRWGAFLALWAVTFGINSYLLLTPRQAT